MARPSRGNTSNNGASTAPEQTTPEAQPEQATPEPHDDGAAEVPLESATPQGGPGPEDFARHPGPRLVSEHAADLALRDEVERRIASRAVVIAERAMRGRRRGEVPIVKIGTHEFTVRARPAKHGGGHMLAEVGKRAEASLD